MKRSLTSTMDTIHSTTECKKIKIERIDYDESDLRSANDYEEIWSQLKNIAFNLVITTNSPAEVNDVTFVLSQDPDKLTFLDIDYGEDSVNCAIKQATKLLYPEGVCDVKLSEYLCMKQKELIETQSLSYLTAVKDLSSDWNAVTAVAGSLFRDFIFNVPKPAGISHLKAKRMENRIILSTQPSIIRNRTASLEVGTAKVELAVAICEHILDGVSKLQSNDGFRRSRNKLIGLFWKRHLKNVALHPERTFKAVRSVVTKYWRHETDEQQIDALTILLIMDIRMLRSKYLLFNEASSVSEELFGRIESDLEMFIQSRDKKVVIEAECIEIPRVMEISTLIIAHLKRTCDTKSFSKKLKTFVRLKLLGRTDLTLIGEYRNLIGEKNGYFTCGNLPTLKWLRETVNEFSPDTTIDIWTQLAGNDFREIIMLSPTRLVGSFTSCMDSIKAAHSALRTNLWIWLSSESQWKWRIKADVQSILYLEQHNRRLEVDGIIVKFDIRYLVT